MSWLSAGLLVVAAVLTVGCGSAEEQKTVKVGEETVVVPRDTPDDPYSVMREVFAQTAYTPWYVDCMMDQMERLLTPKEAEDFANRDAKSRLQGLELSPEAGAHCRPGPERKKIDLSTGKERLAPIRISAATTIKTLAETEGADKAFEACTYQVTRQLPENELVVLLEGSRAETEREIIAIFSRCIGAK